MLELVAELLQLCTGGVDPVEGDEILQHGFQKIHEPAAAAGGDDTLRQVVKVAAMLVAHGFPFIARMAAAAARGDPYRRFVFAHRSHSRG